MKKKKKVLLLVSIITVLVLGLASVSFAAVTDYKSPAEVLAALTDKSVDEITAARESGQSYGAQAVEAGVLDEFQSERLTQYKASLDEAVAAGDLTQEEAAARYAAMSERMATCDGTGTGLGQGNGTGNGTGGGCGMGNSNGNGNGQGRGSRTGQGMGFGSGACGRQG